MSREAWLEKNAFRCAALEARISRAACERYRKGRKGLHVKAWVVPLPCQGCAGQPSDFAMSGGKR